MNKIVIGEGDLGNGFVVVKGYNEDGFGIFHNDVSYWIHGVFMGFDMYVFKDTPEGREIKERIDAKESVFCIRRWLSKILLPRVNPDYLMSKIKTEIERAERRGRRSKAKEILDTITSE